MKIGTLMVKYIIVGNDLALMVCESCLHSPLAFRMVRTGKLSKRFLPFGMHLGLTRSKYVLGVHLLENVQ